jgi:hypothetical protein
MNIEGVVLFSVTPVAADGSIDYTRWKKHLDDALTAGIHSVTLFGSTGANGYFTEAEKMKALEEVATHLGGRVPVMTGIGAMTRSTTRSTRPFSPAPCRRGRHCIRPGNWPARSRCRGTPSCLRSSASPRKATL